MRVSTRLAAWLTRATLQAVAAGVSLFLETLTVGLGWAISRRDTRSHRLDQCAVSGVTRHRRDLWRGVTRPDTPIRRSHWRSAAGSVRPGNPTDGPALAVWCPGQGYYHLCMTRNRQVSRGKAVSLRGR